MQNIIIDEEFRIYLPALDKVTYEGLERQILEHGTRDPLVLWNDILIDGYNRFKICTEHNIPFSTVSLEFDSREDVLDWIIENQLERRNLSPLEVSHYRGVIFNSKKRKQGINNQYTAKSENHQSDGKQTRLNTAAEIGKRFKVSSATIERDARVAHAINAIAAVSLDAKQKILSGEVPIDRSKLHRLSKASKEEIEDVANQINEGTYNRKDHRISRTSDEPKAQGNDVDYAGIENVPHSPDVPERDYVDTIVSLVTGNLNTTLKSLTNDGGIPELKSSLRIFITNLEELYSSIK
ncbi:MAG: hypothetical protein FWE83_06610 [Oscillospiraceae bacterium]|nr:hypothetical protein [Oscillospiraceae bacterium]